VFICGLLLLLFRAFAFFALSRSQSNAVAASRSTLEQRDMTDDDLDPMAILAALGVPDAASAERVFGGWDTVIWRVERPSACAHPGVGSQAGASSALRLFRAGEEETCRREVAAMRAAAAGGLPVPVVHAEGAWRDRPALLLSWCPGRPLRDELFARPWRAWPLGRAFGRMLARVHALPPPDGLRESPQAWIDLAGPDEEPLKARLRSLARGPAALLHLDYHPLNVMTDGTEMTALLDWANARAGDPRADLARALTILRYGPAGAKTRRLLIILLGRVVELACSFGYRQVAGRPEEMAPFHAWAWTMVERDLAPKLGRPGVWLRPCHLEGFRRQAALWKRRAGLPA
jgi:aminoglycoside phosphotransferase (APT) family kinase protein